MAERRMNSTLAHEAGHMLLHGHLFALERRAGARPLLRTALMRRRKPFSAGPTPLAFRPGPRGLIATMDGGGSSKLTRSSVFSFYPVSW